MMMANFVRSFAKARACCRDAQPVVVRPSYFVCHLLYVSRSIQH